MNLKWHAFLAQNKQKILKLIHGEWSKAANMSTFARQSKIDPPYCKQYKLRNISGLI